MRAVIIVRHDRSAPQPVGPRAAGFLETLPGASEIRVKREDFSRVTISHRWKDSGVQSVGMGAALRTQRTLSV